MNRTTEEAHAKINTVLDVTGIRENGYHDVRMIMQELALCDDIMITKTEGEKITIHVTGGGSDIPCDERNIAVKAAGLLKETFGIREGMHIELLKRIPSAAGLGGGSADAAAVMRAGNRLFELGEDPEKLAELSVKIGADVPFCILGGTMLSEGIGEVLTALPPMAETPVLLVKPAENISTKTIYTSLDAVFQEVHHPDVEACMEDLGRNDLPALSAHTGNVLEEVTAALLPKIHEIEAFLKEKGAVLSMMSGSGPTVFGLFEKEETCSRAFAEIKTVFPDCEVVKTHTIRRN